MDVVLGVSMAPTTVRLVLVEGGNADGVIVDQDNSTSQLTATRKPSPRSIGSSRRFWAPGRMPLRAATR